MNKVFSILALLWMLAGTLSAQTVSNLQAGIDYLRTGQRVWNAALMEKARLEFSAEARRCPGDYVPLYWQSVSEFYLMLYYGLEDSAGYDPVKARMLLESAERTMNAALDVRPQEAECHALLSSVYGFRIVMHPLSAVWNGPKVLFLQSKALETEPDNPRVCYVIGAGYFRAPGFVRNVAKARELLERANRLFDEKPAPAAADQPQWGRTECKGMLGDVCREEGVTVAARQFYQAALQINPDYTPAKRGLKELEDEKSK